MRTADGFDFNSQGLKIHPESKFADHEILGWAGLGGNATIDGVCADGISRGHLSQRVISPLRVSMESNPVSGKIVQQSPPTNRYLQIFHHVILLYSFRLVLLQSLGYNTWLYQYAAFIIAAVLAGIAGVLRAYLTGAVTPGWAEVTPSAEALLMVIMGGPGTITGARHRRGDHRARGSDRQLLHDPLDAGAGRDLRRRRPVRAGRDHRRGAAARRA